MPIRTFDEDPEDLFIFLNIIDKRKNKKEHFGSSGSSGNTRGYTASNLTTTEGLMTWSSEVFRIFLSRDVKDKCCKNLNVSNIFCGLPPPTSFCTLITPIAVSGGWAGYSWVYDSVGTDSHNDYWLYVLDDPNTSVYLELRVLTVDSFFI